MQDLFFQSEMKSPIGVLKLYASETHLLRVSMEQEKLTAAAKKLQKTPHKRIELLRFAEKELNLYFRKKLDHFTVPIALAGTPFQQSVWKQLQKISFGELRNYQAHAKSIRKESAVRAVSTAIGTNPISIIVPCHRVIGKNGSLTGFAGGLEAKQWLLEHEGHQIRNEMLL